MIRQPSPRELNNLCLGLNRHGREIVMMALRRGIFVSRTRNAWRFRSAWVDILVADPKFLTERELNPP